jgi:signal peptidase I
MNDYREEADRTGDEDRMRGFDPPPTDYDPLFSTWGESSEVTASRDADVNFLLGRAGPFQSQLFDRGGDALAWELPAAEPFRLDAAAARTDSTVSGQTWYPGPPPYQPPATDAQRRLQEGTITVPRPGRRWAVTLRELVETALLAVLIFLAVRASFQNFQVEGASMQPSLQDGEYLIVNKLTYAGLDTSIFDFLPFYEAETDSVHHLWDAPSRGDIIVFHAPTSIDRDFIKRIIGLPGDTVEINESTGAVSVNGIALTEPYVGGTTNCNAACTRVIPKANTQESRDDCGSNACYFVLGDNRQNSSDSRGGWLVPEENIIGKALLTYWNQGNLDVDLAPNHSVGITDDAAAQE